MSSIRQACSSCHKQFLIIRQELEFLKQKQLPLPTHCPTCRQARRLKLRGERALYKAACQKCAKEIIVTYDPKKVKNMILCKKDYEQYYAENDPIITDPLPEL